MEELSIPGTTLADRLTAQPSEPIPDGGFTEQITESIGQRRVLRPYLARITDHSCDKCGYGYLEYRTRQETQGGRDTLICPRCNHTMVENPFYGPRLTPKARAMLISMREQGYTAKDTRDRIQAEFGIHMSNETYILVIRKAGLPTYSIHNPKRLPRMDKIKALLAELWAQGVKRTAMVEIIEQRLGIRISPSTVGYLRREMGLPKRKAGRFSKTLVASPPLLSLILFMSLAVMVLR